MYNQLELYPNLWYQTVTMFKTLIKTIYDINFEVLY